MFDTNQESSMSESNSNSMISKTPTSTHTLAGDIPKDDTQSTKEMDKINNVTIPGDEF